MRTKTCLTAVIALLILASTAGAQDTLVISSWDAFRVRQTAEGRSIDLLASNSEGDLFRVASITDGARERFVVVDEDDVLVSVLPEDLDRVVATLSATDGEGILYVIREGGEDEEVSWYLQRDLIPAPAVESGPCRRPSVAATPGDT